MFTIGKGLAGILAVIISSVVVSQVTQPGGSPDPAVTTPQAPHAPPIDNNIGQPMYDENVMVFDLKPGERLPLTVTDWWSAPAGLAPSCANGFVLLTWQVREPYPTGGDDLLIEGVIPRSGGRTAPLGRGSYGSIRLDYCDEISVINNSLTTYLVELRYASKAHMP